MEKYGAFKDDIEFRKKRASESPPALTKADARRTCTEHYTNAETIARLRPRMTDDEERR